MMSDDAKPPSSEKIKHLDLIQAVIARMTSESSSMKRYALAAAAAINSTAAGTGTWYLAAAGALLVLVFWLMDAQYLTQERQYRALYEKTRQPDTPADFNLTVPLDIRAQHPLSGAVFGWSVVWLYGSLTILGLIIARVIAVTPPTT